MKIIIVGAGKVGETLTESFIKEKHDVVVIDTNAQTVNSVVNKYDVKGIVGGGLEHSILEDAEVKDTDIFIACTSRDEVNILTCVLAKKFGAKKTVARVRDPEYFREMDNLKEVLGIDMTFNPEYQTAIEMQNVLKFPSAKKLESFANGKAIMAEFDVTKGNPIIGKSLIEISKEYGGKVLFGLVSRGEQEFIPHGNFVIEENDSIHIIGSEKDISNFTKQLDIFKPRAKGVIIIGGGKIAYYLASLLLDSGVDVKIIEKDKSRCTFLAENLPSAVVVNGDGTEQELLDEEGVKKSDAVVTLTGIDEENVIISLYCMQNKNNKVVTKVTRPSILDMVNKLGLDTVLSPRKVIADYIIRFVRAYTAETESGLNTLYKIGQNVEALEFTVSENFKKLGVPLKDINLGQGALIGGIVRDDKFVLPLGDSYLSDGDKVVVVTNKKEIDELRDVVK